MKNVMQLTVVIAMLAIAVPALATQGVSPGATDRMAVVNDRCPTFSWETAEDAALFEIVAYAIHENADPATSELTAETQVLYSRISGAATSWTPSAEQSFAPGGRFVWFVRAVTELSGDEAVEAGEWSEGRYFRVPAGPSQDEVARAVEVLKRWEAAGGSETLFAATATATATDTVTDTGSDADADAIPNHRKGEGEGEGVGEGQRKSVPTASAAIKGEHPSTSGEAYGIVGTSASADGAGVAAANLDGGADLVLDGSADGQVDTLLSQFQIDRPSPVDEHFRFRNTGAGFLNVLVDGELSASRVIGDELWVPYGMVVDDEGNWQGSGDTIPCDDCVTADSIADGQVDVYKLSAQGSYNGWVLKSDGTSVDWAEDEELNLPFAGSANTSDPVFHVANSGVGAGWAIHAEADLNNAIVGDAQSNGSGVLGRNLSTTGLNAGVAGLTNSDSGAGVRGSGSVYAPGATGVKGESNTGAGVKGESDTGAGVMGLSTSGPGVVGEVVRGHGVYGISHDSDNNSIAAGVHGVYAASEPWFGVGVLGERDSRGNWGALGSYNAGVYGSGSEGHGVTAKSTGSGIYLSALWAEAESADGIAIHAISDSSDATIVANNEGQGDVLRLFNGGNLRLKATYNGNLSIDGNYASGGADFAELLPAFSDDLEPGDVLAIAADGRLMRSQQAYQASVVGVYSTKPGILGGSGIDSDPTGKIPLAVVGVVPVKTCDENGPVRPGDMLVASSIPGHAMRAGERTANGRVIGKALSGLESGEGLITMLVILQ